MQRRVEIIGNNRLAAYLARRCVASGSGGEALYRFPAEADGTQPAFSVIVEHLDKLDPRTVAEAQTAGTLQITFWRSYICIGPYFKGMRAGCGYCQALRTRASEAFTFVEDGEKTPSRIDDPVFSPLALNAVRNLLTAEIQVAATGTETRTSKGTLIVDSQYGTVSFEPLLPSSECPVCAQPEPRSTVPTLTAGGRDSELDPSKGYRSADAASLTVRLNSVYLHRHSGMLKEVLYDLQSPFAACTLELKVANRTEYVLGRSITYEKSRSVAMLEAVERFCGMRQPASSRVVTATFEAIAEQAINPLELGLYPETSYDLPLFPLQRFSASVISDWVPAYSLCRFQEVLVPASVAFYGHKQSHGKPFLMDSSNGCAVGASVEEAALHGLFEVIERDAFLLSWYRKLALTEIDLEDVTDLEVRMLLRKAELVTNCQYRIFRSTMEHGIPSVVALAISRQRNGPQIMASGGAHLQLARAVKSALYEVIGLVMRLRHQYEKKVERAYRLFNDPNLVRVIEDHPLSNSVAQARARFSFLLQAELRKISWAEACDDDPKISSAAAGGALAEVVGFLQKVGLETIILNQTFSEAAAGGLHCVKTIVPGLLPMTFGHAFRRVNLLRLMDPTRCKYESALHDSEEPGSIPHPFP